MGKISIINTLGVKVTLDSVSPIAFDGNVMNAGESLTAKVDGAFLD